MRVKLFLCAALTVVFCLALRARAVQAAPWDIDMNQQQSLKTSEVARSPVRGTVPAGRRRAHQTLEEAEGRLTNPVARSARSEASGERMWNVHCAVCHGRTGDGMGPVGPMVGAANLLRPLYQEKTDARIYGVIFYGLRAMPKQGYKLSPEEAWDTVNYLRKLQELDAAGGTKAEEGGK